MKHKFTIYLALVLGSGLLGFSQIAGKATGSTNLPQSHVSLKSDWGPASSGFQMAAVFDETNKIIYCWIRNATSYVCNYPSFDFGYPEYISLEVQVATNWINLRPWIFPKRDCIIVPPPYESKAVGPHKVISDVGSIVNSPLREPNSRDGSIRTAFLVCYTQPSDDAGVEFTNLVKAIDMRWAVMTNLCHDDTFSIDLAPPKPFETGGLPDQSKIKVRVCQKFRINGGKQVDVLTSPEFVCSIKK